MPVTDHDSFGARMRHERERRQISLQSIAERTKIGIGLLKGLERDDVSRWPSGIFRRSFIRAYAEATGLDAEATTQEFLEQFPEPVDAATGRVRLPPDAAHLRLWLADDARSFLPEGLRYNWRRRCEAMAWDLTVIATSAAILSLSLGAFWMPMALAAVGYYASAVLLLGNTPGVCLSARKTTSTPLPGSEPTPAEDVGVIVSSP